MPHEPSAGGAARAVTIPAEIVVKIPDIKGSDLGLGPIDIAPLPGPILDIDTLAPPELPDVAIQISPALDDLRLLEAKIAETQERPPQFPDNVTDLIRSMILSGLTPTFPDADVVFSVTGTAPSPKLGLNELNAFLAEGTRRQALGIYLRPGARLGRQRAMGALSILRGTDRFNDPGVPEFPNVPVAIALDRRQIDRTLREVLLPQVDLLSHVGEPCECGIIRLTYLGLSYFKSGVSTPARANATTVIAGEVALDVDNPPSFTIYVRESAKIEGGRLSAAASPTIEIHHLTPAGEAVDTFADDHPALGLVLLPLRLMQGAVKTIVSRLLTNSFADEAPTSPVAALAQALPHEFPLAGTGRPGSKIVLVLDRFDVSGGPSVSTGELMTLRGFGHLASRSPSVKIEHVRTRAVSGSPKLRDVTVRAVDHDLIRPLQLEWSSSNAELRGANGRTSAVFRIDVGTHAVLNVRVNIADAEGVPLQTSRLISLTPIRIPPNLPQLGSVLGGI